jgi:hypothetical protein
MPFGENAIGEADNQQGSRQLDLFDDWLTPQRLHAELLAASKKSLGSPPRKRKQIETRMKI